MKDYSGNAPISRDTWAPRSPVRNSEDRYAERPPAPQDFEARGRDPRDPRDRDPREPRDPRERSRDPRDRSRDPRDRSRDSRDPRDRDEHPPYGGPPAGGPGGFDRPPR